MLSRSLLFLGQLCQHLQCKELEQLSVERDTTKSEVMATALKLYAAAFAGRKRGMAVGLADPQTRQLQTEFIGL